ncbi:hypothetical protein KCU65_g77, partial [Aureobasidium melanogenum]
MPCLISTSDAEGLNLRSGSTSTSLLVKMLANSDALLVIDPDFGLISTSTKSGSSATSANASRYADSTSKGDVEVVEEALVKFDIVRDHVDAVRALDIVRA